MQYNVKALYENALNENHPPYDVRARGWALDQTPIGGEVARKVLIRVARVADIEGVERPMTVEEIRCGILLQRELKDDDTPELELATTAETLEAIESLIAEGLLADDGPDGPDRRRLRLLIPADYKEPA